MSDKQWVAQKLSTLSLEDKVGEMTQLSIDVLAVGSPYNLKEPFEFDEAKLRNILVDLKVGSILNVGGHAYDRKLWEKIITTIQKIATEEKSSGIPVLYGIDAIHGTNYTQGSTLFPQQLALASTFNTELAFQCGEVTAYETRASGIPWNFAPVLDLGKDPRWPRLWETFGEDVLVSQTMGAAYIEGSQGDNVASKNKVATTMKHFLGYSTSLSGKDRTPAWIPERMLQEHMVPSFQAAVDAGAKTIMICSGEMNGIPVHTDEKILKDLLRDQMGFEGLAVTDWEDIGYLVNRHRVAVDFKDAIKQAINAGIDMAMVPMDARFPVLLKELVEEGEVPMSRIDEAVSRILLLKKELGLFETPYHDFSEYEQFASEDFRMQSYQAACESVILLENRNKTLPLNASETNNILIAGPTSNNLRSLNGGWTGTWQGDNPVYDTPGKKNMVEAFQEKFGDNVTYHDGQDKASFEKSCAGSDVIILCLGELSYTETPGNLNDLNLPQDQIDLFKMAKASGKKVILVMLEGRPRIIREIQGDADAIVLSFLPGNEGALAIRDVILGDVNPSGKLPITYPQWANDLVNYDHKGTNLVHADFSMNGFQPQWEFGHGLSYSEFMYSDLTLSAKQMGLSDKINISVTVTNKSDRVGMESIHLFVSDHVASITPVVKKLRAFTKVELEPGQSKTLNFELDKSDLSFVGRDNEWITEPGKFTVSVGGLSEEFEVR